MSTPICYKITDEKLDHVGHEDYIMVKDLQDNDLTKIPGIGKKMARDSRRFEGFPGYKRSIGLKVFDLCN